MPPFERHIFVCANTRPEDAPRPSCNANGKAELHTAIQQLAKAAGLTPRIRINKSGCLDQCEHGPNVVVYPDAVWYGHITEADVDEIIESHILGGKPVERLRLADSCLNTPTCEHRKPKT